MWRESRTRVAFLKLVSCVPQDEIAAEVICGVQSTMPTCAALFSGLQGEEPIGGCKRTPVRANRCTSFLSEGALPSLAFLLCLCRLACSRSWLNTLACISVEMRQPFVLSLRSRPLWTNPAVNRWPLATCKPQTGPTRLANMVRTWDGLWPVLLIGSFR